MIEQKITDTLERNYMPYAMSVIVSRAIPEIDGFKPSHRKLLYTMYKMGSLGGMRTKSANVVGQTMKLNPHGDMAIYETLVRLTTGNQALLHPLIDSKGNFGKQYSRDMAFAAARYTEVKLAGIASEIFSDIDKDTVDFVDNYDGTLKEPRLLPVKYPSILVNANQGIAVGMASNICSFNLAEVCDTTIEYLKNPECDLTATLKAPDFPTGGQIIYDEATIKNIYETGRGTFRIKAKYSYDKKNNCIDISEIPYTTTIEAIIDKIADLIKRGKIREISDVRDETDLHGLKITIDLKRGTDVDKLMAKLFKSTPLYDSFGCNFNILDKDTPKVMGIRQVLRTWSAFRVDCVRRGLLYDIDKKSQRLHLLQGLEKILVDIDKAIKIIRQTELEKDVISNLMKGFSIDEIQAEFIAEIKLRNLNREYIIRRIEDIERLKGEIKDYTEKSSDDGKIKKIIIGELKDIKKKYFLPRKSEIIADDVVQEILDEIEEIEDYPVTLFFTGEGYLKKITNASLRGASEHKFKEGDGIIWQEEATNRSEILVFTNKQAVYKIRAHEIPDCKASQLGEYLPGMLELIDDEEIIGITVTIDFAGHILFCYENGKMAKITLSSYQTKQNRRKLANAYYGGSALVEFHKLSEDREFLVISNINKMLVFNTMAIGEKTTRDSQGVSVMKQKKNSKVKSVIPVENLNIKDLGYYRTKNIPAVGCFQRSDDVQTSFEISIIPEL